MTAPSAIEGKLIAPHITKKRGSVTTAGVVLFRLVRHDPAAKHQSDTVQP
jgi:hypothetical protein